MDRRARERDRGRVVSVRRWTIFEAKPDAPSGLESPQVVIGDVPLPSTAAWWERTVVVPAPAQATDDEAEAFVTDNSGHDVDCDCKACLIDTWHAEVQEVRQLAARYRRGLERIRDEAKWCDDYAMCDHVGCESANRAWETAKATLNLEVALWPGSHVKNRSGR
jgi:hypothetical protein